MEAAVDINNMIKLKLPEWDEIPDFGIYREQLIKILQGIYVEEDLDDRTDFSNRQERLGLIVTPSMINNYVKWGLVPKPKKKRYNRECIALFLMITSFKTVLRLDEIQVILKEQTEKRNIKDLYMLIKDINDFANHKRLTEFENCPEVFDGRGDASEIVIFCGIFDALYILLSVKMRIIKSKDQAVEDNKEDND